MRALRYRTPGAGPEVVEVPTPEPGPGQVLLRVTAAGVCHSDFVVMSMTPEQRGFPLPLTLGHEGVGTVAGLGDGVTGLAVGAPVAVYGPWGCGRCVHCCRGAENYCERARELGIFPPGLGWPGAIAEYMLIDDARHLVPLGTLDPVAAVSLTDAGLTPYHAIKRALPGLPPGGTAVVIGVGGLGHVAVRILRALSTARVVAADVSADKLDLAKRVGAHVTVPSDDRLAATVTELTGGLGAEAVFDFVGSDATVRAAGAMAAVDGTVMIVGLGGGALPVGFGTTRFNVAVRAPYWGTRDELVEVLDLARAGAVSVDTETYTLDEAPTAYQRLREGRVTGRAVILPNG